MSSKSKILIALTLILISLIVLVSFIYFKPVTLDSKMVNDIRENDKDVVFNTSNSGVNGLNMAVVSNIEEEKFIYPRQGSKNIKVENGRVFFKGVTKKYKKEDIVVKAGEKEISDFNFVQDKSVLEVQIGNILSYNETYSVKLDNDWYTDFKTEKDGTFSSVVDVVFESNKITVYFEDFITIKENKYVGLYENTNKISETVEVKDNSLVFLFEGNLDKDKLYFVHIPKNTIETDIKKLTNKTDYNILVEEE